MPSGIHSNPNCQCCFCKGKQGERKHKPNCQCSFCKAERGELSGKNNGMYGRTGDKHPMFGRTGEKSHLWKEDDIKYGRKHKRIIEQKGKASDYKCVGDGINSCNKQARHWSNVDHLYSLDPDNYQPRCVSCHRKYDIKLIFQK